jgi:hypothetical protein
MASRSKPASGHDDTVQRDAVGLRLDAPLRETKGSAGPARQRQHRMLESRQREARSPARQTRERGLQLHVFASEDRRAIAAGVGDRHILQLQIGRRQKPDVDGAGNDDARAQNVAELGLDLRAMKRPIDKKRREKRRRQRHDQRDRDKRKNYAHGMRSIDHFERHARHLHLRP